MKTQEIKKLVTTKLKKFHDFVYFQVASTNAPKEYIVFDFEQINLDDIERDDIKLVIDVWGVRLNTGWVDDVSDLIEKEFNTLNAPGNGIYPTFYRYDRQFIEDEDKSKYRNQIKFIIQNYD